MHFIETDEQQALRAEVAKIASAYGPAYWIDKASRFEPQRELWDALGKQGFIGVNVGEAYGGGGLGILELAMVCEEVAAQGCPLLLLLVSPAICGTVIEAWGDDEQKQRWLPGIASGERRMAFAITEPDAGSNSHQLSTTARRDGDSWVISGSKYYISGLDECEQLLLVARSSTEQERGRLSLFVVDVDAPGLEKTPIPMSFNAPERQFTLFFDDVRVEADRLIGREGDGLRQVFSGLNPERILSAASCTGVARYALARGAEYARQRAVWGGKPIGTHQGLAHPLAERAIEVELARLMTLKAAWQHDNGQSAGEASNMAKFAAAEAGLGALDQAIQTHGGNGMASEYQLAQLWGMLRVLRIAPVSREMILNFVAQHTLKLPKSY